MKILYLYVSTRKDQHPDTLFYGALELKKLGHEVNYFDDIDVFYKIICWPISKIIYWITGYGFKLDLALSLLPKFSNYDAIVACGSSPAMPLALLKLLKLVTKPIFCIHMGGAEKSSLFKILYLQFEKIIAFSKSEEDFINNKFHLNNVVFCPLGIDTKFFSPAPKSQNEYYLAVGRDRNRDFKRLLGIKTPLKIVTSKRNVQALKIPKNIEVFFDLSYVELRKMYAKAKAVLLPLNSTDRASGQLVMLESLSMNKPVIASNSPGLISGYDDLLPFVTFTKDFTIDVTTNILSREVIINKYSSEKLARRLEKILYENI